MQTIHTSLGEHPVIVLPDGDDAWWVCLDRIPPELANGGPTVASGSSPERAADVLAVAIDRFLHATATHAGGPS